MKINQFAKQLLVDSLRIGSFEFDQGMTKHSVKCLMMETHGNEQQKKYTIHSQIRFSDNDIEKYLESISNNCLLIPWKTMKFRRNGSSKLYSSSRHRAHSGLYRVLSESLSGISDLKPFGSKPVLQVKSSSRKVQIPDLSLVAFDP